MQILVFGGSILVGFVFGYFFALPALITVTLACIGMAMIVLKDWRSQELGQLFSVSVVIIMAIGNVSMWITYYLTTEQRWIGEFLHGYVLR